MRTLYCIILILGLVACAMSTQAIAADEKAPAAPPVVVAADEVAPTAVPTMDEVAPPTAPAVPEEAVNPTPMPPDYVMDPEKSAAERAPGVPEPAEGGIKPVTEAQGTAELAPPEVVAEHAAFEEKVQAGVKPKDMMKEAAPAAESQPPDQGSVAPAPQEKVQAKAEAPAMKPLTKEEEIKYLKQILENRQDIVVNGVQVTKGEAGTEVTFNGKKLEDLDVETLRGLSGQVGQQISLKNMERLQRQLRDLRQRDDFSRNTRNLNQPRPYTPPRIPQPYRPPQIPKVPKTTR